MKREEFLKNLSSMSKEEINRIITEKGKPPKIINPIIVLDQKLYEENK